MNSLKNKQIVVKIGNIHVGNNFPFVLFGGLNVLESKDLAFHVCDHFISITKKLNIPYVFKASFDKANRSCIDSYRGPGLDKGLQILSELKEKFRVNILTDVHETYQVKPVSQIVDVIQIPAFLARQTDLIKEIANTRSAVNIKKPQFISPWQTFYIVEKFRKSGNNKLMLCERGSSFGYDNLVVDMLGINIMRKVTCGCPIILDISHALQTREKFSSISGGRREQIFELARSGISVGIAGIFVEAHPNPDMSKCDGRSSLHLKKLEQLLNQIKPIDDLIKSFKDLYQEY